MPLTLTSNFVAKTNSVLPLAQATGINGLAIRAASGATDILGTLTASGTTSVVAFSLSPETPAWVTGQIDNTGLIFTISFSNAVPNGTIPYEFYVICTDGVNTLYFPILLDVKPPLSLAILAGPYTGETTLNIPSYDDTIADIEIQPIGLSNIPVSGVSFILPGAPPTGMELLTSDGTNVTLHLSDPSPTNIPGGLQTYINQPVTEQLTILAYAPGFFYDEPDRAFPQVFTIQSLTAKAGTLDFMVSVYFNIPSNLYQLTMDKDFLQGQGASEALNILWTASPAGGAAGSPGSGTGSSFQWTPSAGNPGTVSFTVTLQGAVSNRIYGTKTIGPIQVGGAGAANWSGTNGLKLKLNVANGIYQGYVGDNFGGLTGVVLSADGNGAEIITVTFPALETGSGLESVIAPPSSVVLNVGNSYTATVPAITVPNSTIHQKWGLRCVATSNSSRTGFAEATLLSNGLKSLVINNSALLTGNTGSTIIPYQLTAEDVDTLAPVSATFSLVGAPNGLNINASKQIVGNALQAGVYTFQVLAEAPGYINTTSGNFVLTVTQVATPLTISNPNVVGAVTTPAIQTNNTPFTVAWSISGLATTTYFLQSGSVSGPRSVLNATQAATSQPTSSVISVYGSSFYGNAYSIPIIVLSSSIQASQQLLPSPTIGTIDENFGLTLNWQPFIVAGGYTIYKAWDIYVNQPPAAPPLGLQTVNGNLPTGLEFPGSSVSNRIFETNLSTGDWTVSMTALTNNPSIATNSAPWDSPKLFPTTLTPADVTLSSTTLQLGQTLDITLSPSYAGANYWSITYQDGTTTGFLPISARSQAKAFTEQGQQNITIETEYDYSTSTPPVKLRRSLVLQVYVTNQQFTSTPSSQNSLSGTLGVGGEQGFEIINATNSVATPQPWEVISRSLVRDTVTNELKLMVMTSRYASASSLLNTAALDMFPIPQRPLSLETIDITPQLDTTSATSSAPVAITTTNLPNIIVGKPMTAFLMQAAQGTAPYSWYTDTTLPFGLNLSIDGTLYGTPLELGTFNIDFSVQDSSVPASISTVTLPIVIGTDLVITTNSPLPSAQVNTPYNLQFTNTGGLPPFTWVVAAGAFPLGLTLDPQKGLLSGVPVTYNSTTDFTTTFTATVQITDTIGAIVTKVFTIQLIPAALQFGGSVDQPIITASEQYKLSVPVFGGQSPYTLTAFTDDGIIGSGLQIVSPTEDTVTLVAGMVPPVLTITTSPGPTPFYPQVYPQNISFDLNDFTSGGTPPYNWSITVGAPNTLANAAVFGSMLTGTVTVNGFVTVGVTCVDSVGHIASGVFSIFSQKQNDATVGFQIFPVAISFNGTQNNPFNWLILPITNPPTTAPQQINNTSVPPAGPAAPFPDAKVGQAWTPANVDADIFTITNPIHSIYQNYQFFGFACYQNGKLHLTQNGAPNKVYANSTIFNLGDTIQDNNGHLEIVTTGGTTGAGPGQPTWSTTGGTTVDGTVTWTESVVSIPGQMVFLNVGEDEEPSDFPNWLNVQNGTTIAGGAFRDFSGIVAFNVTGGSSPATTGAYSFLPQFSSIVATTGNLVDVAQRSSITVTTTGEQALPPSATAQVQVTATNFFPLWQPTQGYVVNDQILDLNGNTQRVTSISAPGVSGAAVPLWNKTNGGTTVDNQVTWTNEGKAPGLTINLTTLQNPNNNPYPWYNTLQSESGIGPYIYQIVSITSGLSVNPSTLPGVTLTSLNNLPAFSSNTTIPGNYQVTIVAIDFSGRQSPPAVINVTLLETATQQIHILNNFLPIAIYGPPIGQPGELGRPIPSNMYFIQSDLVANWEATGLPGGVSFTTAPSNRAYLQGTPTSSGTFNVTVTAISASYGTTATFNFVLVVNPRQAFITAPLPVAATVGLDYRAINNNALFKVTYVGYQPTDSDLPLLHAVTGVVGAPGVTNQGLPTTQVTNLTPDGFVMLFDYQNNTVGNDTISLKHNLNTFLPQVTLNIVYASLLATGTTPTSATVSEYAITATIQPPVSIQGGNPPYNINITGESDPRFVPQFNISPNASLLITVANFAPGGTYVADIQMTVTDTEAPPQTSIATGTVTVTIQQETYITVNYTNQTWAVSSFSVSNVYYLVLPQNGVSVVLGHPPYQYNITGLTIPGGLTGKVTISPSQRVIAINTVGSPVNVNDVGSNLAPQGSFTVPSTVSPSIGSYTINVSYQVIDAHGIVSNGAANVIVNIS